MKNILFYKYVELENTEEMKEYFLEKCASLNILGTILLADEGINGCLTGEDNKIEEFKVDLRGDDRFSDIEFKEASVGEHGFRKLKVKTKKEIVRSDFKVDVSQRGQYIEPEELKKMFEEDEDFVMVDMRNNYESDVGVFDKTIALDIDKFRDVPKAMHQLEKIPKDKTIVAYCTGGIRCEKGTAYLKSQGFQDVRHLHGGILRYGRKVGNRFWNGKCFVFDRRVVVDIDPKNKSNPISKCSVCSIPTAHYDNCKLIRCDKRFLSCEKCFDSLKGYCSKKCRNDGVEGKYPSRAQ